MRPRPLYRWKSFWFDLLTLAFMGWAWRDSLRACSAIGWESGMVMRWRGASYLLAGKRWGTLTGWSLIREPSDGEWHCAVQRKIHQRWVRVPDAAVFFPFLLAWVAFLGWRWRRQSESP